MGDERERERDEEGIQCRSNKHQSSSSEDGKKGRATHSVPTREVEGEGRGEEGKKGREGRMGADSQCVHGGMRMGEEMEREREEKGIQCRSNKHQSSSSEEREGWEPRLTVRPRGSAAR